MSQSQNANVQFECKTCHEKGPADQLMKHLSTTRHKTVIDVTTHDDPEELCCEECKDNNNIHQLVIIRFGGDDMEIYCQSCLNKLLNRGDIDDETKKSMTSYTLQNGALLPFWLKYKRYRDCVCDRCHQDDAKMNVLIQKNTSNNSKTTVICDNCLSKIPNIKKDGFISEDSDKFIYYLLNIPEPANKPKKHNKRKNLRGRRGRKKGGRRGKSSSSSSSSSKSGKPQKPMTLMEKMTKEAFSNKRENSKIVSASTTSLSSFKGFAAVNSETNLQKLVTDNNNANKKDNGSSKKNNNSSQEKIKRIQSEPSMSKLRNSKDLSTSKKKNSPLNKQNIGNKSDLKLSNKTNSQPKQTSIDKENKPTKKGPNSKKEKNPLKDNINKNEKTKTDKTKKQQIQTDAIQNTKTKGDKSKNIKSKESSPNKNIAGNNKTVSENPSWSDGWGHHTLDSNDKSNSTESLSSVSSKNKKNKNKKKNNNSKKDSSIDLVKGASKTKTVAINKDADKTPDVSSSSWSEGWGGSFEDAPSEDITDKGNKAQTKSKKEKKKEKSNNNNSNSVENDRTLEEGSHWKPYEKYKPKLTYPDMKTYFDTFSYALFQEEKLETPFMRDIKIMWPRDKKEIVFLFKTAIDNPELQSLLPPHLLKAGRVPFNEQQPLMLVNKYDESQVWYIFVKEVAKMRKEYHVLVELFPWNFKPLPLTLGSDDLMILPTSVQTNRMIFSMTRLTNPKFVQLVLGNEKLKQIKFNNRLKFSRPTLNDSQKDAVETVLNNSVTVIQGPPGTGKTSTIEEIIVQLIENLHTYPILCVAASNIAIDNIAEKLMESKPDIKILRILSTRKESEYSPDHPLGSICLHNMILRDLSPDMRANYLAKQSGEILSANQDKKLYEKITKLTTAHVCRAQVILTTNVTSGGRQLKVIKELPVVIMDESTQSSEVSTLVPLSLPGIKKFVFVGDDKQLSSFSNVPQLEMSLFQRILENGSYEEPKMLNIQYRMHPQISEFPIKQIYDNKLQDGVTVADKSWDNINYPLYFIRCQKGSETKVLSKRGDGDNFRLQGYTYINTNECDVIISMIYKLMDEKNVKLEDIGIVTPYSAQRDYISSRLVDDLVINPKRLAMVQEIEEDEFAKGNKNEAGTANGMRSHTVNIVNGLQVATVDSFQGHEKNFIIFSCVRNNPENKIGFLTDKRRLNVALTRSKYGLILVGNDYVLERGGGLWKKYIDYLGGHDLIFPSLDKY